MQTTEEGSVVEVPNDELAVGTELGSYRILELLGEGGMGRVYVAEHIKLGRRVALKMLRPQYAANPVAVARFFAEARAVNRISHENIVAITDFFENPGGANYFIMELLRGEDLARVIMREGALPVSRVVEIARQIAGVLAAVHDAKIIHRDLKPDNVFLINRPGHPDFVKLLDFGVAKLSDTQGPVKLQTTAIGAIIGTPEYMSPEQAGGQEVDQRSDIYSLGVIMYEMLSGQRPFKGKSFGEMVIKHMTVDPKPLGEYANLPEPLPGSVEALVTSLLAKDREDRPQTMAEVEETLDGIQDYVSPIVEVRRSESMRIRRPPSGRSDINATPSAGVTIAPQRVTGREPTIEAMGSQADLPVPSLRASRKPLWIGAGVVAVVGAIVLWLAMRSSPDNPATIEAAPKPAARSPEPMTPPPPPLPSPVTAAVQPTPAPPPPPVDPKPEIAPAPATTPPAPAKAKRAKPPSKQNRADRGATMDVFGGK